jgi:hypothetical protein
MCSRLRREWRVAVQVDVRQGDLFALNCVVCGRLLLESMVVGCCRSGRRSWRMYVQRDACGRKGGGTGSPASHLVSNVDQTPPGDTEECIYLQYISYLMLCFTSAHNALYWESLLGQSGKRSRQAPPGDPLPCLEAGQEAYSRICSGPTPSCDNHNAAP